MDPDTLARRIRQEAADRGLEWVGVVAPETEERDAETYRRWLEAGHHGAMAYMARPDAVARREALEETMAEVRSVVVLAEPYHPEDPEGIPDDPSKGVVARYARGRDYHKVLLRKLQAILRELPEGVGGRAYVDTGPILERALGRMAGLGWQGKNTMLIHPRRGSYFFLGTLLLDAEVAGAGGAEEVGDHCGTCRACLDACPTGALLGRDETGAPVMDARKCISYLTIELRGSIPRELRPLMGNRVFGCDICQEVCPWNERFAAGSAEPGYAARGPGERPTGVEASEAPVIAEAETGGDVLAGTSGREHAHPGTDSPSLIELLEMALAEGAWDDFSRGSAIRRAGRAGFARNVCVGLGNWGSSEAVPVLSDALFDPEPVVRSHAAWALGRVDSAEARSALSSRFPRELVPTVAAEINAALDS